MNEIDTRVVEMQFENGKFERDIAKTIKSLAELDDSLLLKNASIGFNEITNAANNVSLQGILSGVEWLQNRFSLLGSFVYNLFDNITSKAIAAGQQIINSVTIQPVMEGFQEYNLKTTSTQTILNNVKRQGQNMEDVSEALDILNEYADKTVYNYAQMVQTMSGASNAGLDTHDLLTYSMGLSNLAAYQGVDNTAMNRAGYQINQALTKGYFALQDWNSVVNANLGTQSFQDELIATARESGLDIDSILAASEGDFRTSLQQKWLTKDIFLKTLAKYTDTETELGRAAYEAATKTKTLQESLDQIHESLGSGWTKTFEVLIGNVEQAKEFWSTITNGVLQITDTLSDSRNELLSTVMDDAGGRQIILDIIQSIIVHVQEFVTAVGKGFSAVFGDLKEYAPSIIGFLTAIRDALSADYSKTDNMNRRFKELNIITNIAKGAATAVKVLITALKGIGIVLKPIVKIVGGFALKLLEVSSSIGEFIFGLGKAESAEDTFLMVCYAIANAIDAIPGKLNDFKNTVIEVWETIRQTVKDKTGFDIAQPFIDAWNAVSDFISNLKASFEDGSIWSKIQERFQPILDFFGQFKIDVSAIDVGETIGNVVSDIIEKFEKLKTDLEAIGLPTTFEELGKKLEDPINFIKNLFDNLIGNGDEESTSLFDFANVLDRVNTFLSSIGETIASTWTAIAPTLSIFWEKIQPMVDPLIATLTSIFEAIEALFKNIGEEGLTAEEIISIGLTGALIIFIAKLDKMANNLASITKIFNKAFEDLSNGIGSAIDNLNKKLESEAFRNFAIGLAAIVASFVALSFLNIENLGAATTAIMVPILSVIAVLEELVKHKDALDTPVLLALGKFFSKFGTSVLRIALGLRVLTKYDKASVASGGAILGLLIEEASIIIEKMLKIPKSSAELIPQITALSDIFKVISLAALELAAAVWVIGQIGDPVTVLQAWGVVEILLASVVGAMLLLTEKKQYPSVETVIALATAMIEIAWAVDMLAAGIALISILDMNKVATATEVIVAIASMVAFVYEATFALAKILTKDSDAATLTAMSTAILSVGLAMIMMAAAVDIIVAGIAVLAALPLSADDINEALFVVEITALILTGMVALLEIVSYVTDGVSSALIIAAAGSMIMMALAIDIIIVGIIALGIALGEFEKANIGFDQFMGVLGAVMIFSAVMAIIGLFTAGVGGLGILALSVSLVIIAGAILMMTESMKTLTNVDDATFIKGLVLLAAVAIIFAALTGMMLLAAPEALVLSVAAIAIGVAAMFLGAAFMEFAFGLAAIASAGTISLPVIVAVFAAMSSGLWDGFLEGFKKFLAEVPTLVPLMVDALWAVIDGAFTLLIDLLVYNASSAVTGSIKVIIALAKVASPLIAKLIEVLIDLLVDVLQGLNDGLERNKHDLSYYIGNIIALILEITIEALWTAIIKLFEWLSIVGPVMYKEALKVGTNFIDSIFKGLKEGWVYIYNWAKEKTEELLSLLPNAEKIKTKIAEGVDGAIKGLKEGAKGAGDAANNVANNILGGLFNPFDINSPSKVMQNDFVGTGIIGGILKGFDIYSNDAVSSVETMSKDLINTANNSLLGLDILSMFDDMTPTITPVVDLTDVEDSIGDINSMFPSSTYDFASITGMDFNYMKDLKASNQEAKDKNLESLFSQLTDQEQALTDAILNANTDTKIYLDKDILVGSTYRDIDKRLGKQALMERRM